MEKESEQVTLQNFDSKNKVPVKEVGKNLFECANHLRGHVDPGEYKDYILPLVFYAEINRRFEKRYEEQLAEFEENKDVDKNFRETVREYTGKDLVDEIVIPQEHNWESLLPKADEEKIYAEEIDTAFEAFEENNPDYEDMFEDNFRNVSSFLEDGNKDIREVIKIIHETVYDRPDGVELPPDTLGEAFMYLVNRFSKSESGEFFTPPRVSRLIVQLLEPLEPGASFHDPTAGSGGFNVEVANQIERRYDQGWYNDMDIVAPSNNRETDFFDFLTRNGFQFTGQELNPTIASIGKMNLALHNIEATIKQGDCLSNPRFVNEETGDLQQFDYILANFPFSESGWKDAAKNRQDRFNDLDWDDSLPHGNYGDFAFIMHMYSHLSEGGQIATVIPHGVLFRNGDQPYREYMIENDLVEAVIGLPENLFEATGIQTAVLILNDDKPPAREGEVMFFNAVHEDRFYVDTGSDRNHLIDPVEDGTEKGTEVYSEMDKAYGTAEIKQMFDKWVDEERVCRVVSNDEIRENEYNLNIALYVDSTEPQEDISVEDTLSTIHDLETEYESLNNQLTTYMQQLNYEGENDE